MADRVVSPFFSPSCLDAKNLLGFGVFGGACFVCCLCPVSIQVLSNLILSLSQYKRIADRPCLKLVWLPRKKKESNRIRASPFKNSFSDLFFFSFFILSLLCGLAALLRAI